MAQVWKETSGKSVTQQRLDHLRKADILQKAELEKSRRLEWRAHQQRVTAVNFARPCINFWLTAGRT